MATPHRILMLAFPDCQMLDVTGPLQMFAGANDALGRKVYELALIAPQAGPFATSSGIQLVADHALGAVDAAGAGTTVIAAGGDGGVRRALAEGDIPRFISDAAQAGARIVSVCSGAFLLAEAGLLDGKRAATHWDAVERLRRFRPTVTVDPDAIYIRDGGVWTSAGVTAGIDLALALIEADHGRAVALAVARRHVVMRIRPGGQSQFSPDLAAGAAGDPRLRRLAEKITLDPQADWRGEALAAEACVSLRSLTRLFERELHTTPAEFVERVRVDQARRALLDSNAPVEVVAHASGFGSLRRMDRAFARLIRATPSEFRARFKTTGASP